MAGIGFALNMKCMVNAWQNCHHVMLWLSVKKQLWKADSTDKGKFFSSVFDKSHNMKSGWKLVTSSPDKKVFFSE